MPCRREDSLHSPDGSATLVQYSGLREVVNTHQMYRVCVPKVPNLHLSLFPPDADVQSHAFVSSLPYPRNCSFTSHEAALAVSSRSKSRQNLSWASAGNDPQLGLRETHARG